MIHSRSFYGFSFLLIVIALFSSCREDSYPRPVGYFRIDLPQKQYLPFDTTFPYSFQYPQYAKTNFDRVKQGEKYWMNIVFPRFNGSLHISYKPLNGNLNKYLEDTRTLVMKHIPKASGIETKTYENPDQRVYGLTYTIAGYGAASPYQFYLTDSTNHFLRGALYFNNVPNNDSLAPVIDFLKKDIDHLIETFTWKEGN